MRKVDRISRKCLECRNPFLAGPENWKKKFCSPSCSTSSRNKKSTKKICSICDDEFFGKNLERVCEVCVPHNVSDKGRWKRYGLTRPDFERLLQDQNGKCAICKTAAAYWVDHEHVDGFRDRDKCKFPQHERRKYVRGLLCLDCNTRLSVIEDGDFMKKATEYLNRRNT